MFDLDALIRQELTSDEPNPHEVAKTLVRKIPKRQLGEVLVRCLADRVREVVRFERMRARGTLSSTTGRAPGQQGENRLTAASKTLQRYYVAGEWKMWPDLTADDFDTLADQHEIRAAKETALAERFRTLAAHMRRVGAGTAKDLEEEAVELADAA